MKKLSKKVWFFGGLLVVCLAAFLISKYYVQVMLIQGNSMKPTYHNLSIVLVDKHSKEYGIGDVIVFHTDNVKGSVVKRIVAGPLDEIWIEDGMLYVNGMKSNQQRESVRIDEPGILKQKIKVPADAYFVLGDNYSESIDSRYEEIGYVFQNQIDGKLIR